MWKSLKKKKEEWGVLEVEGDHLLHPQYLYKGHTFIVIIS